jgi:hypothetical protein
MRKINAFRRLKSPIVNIKSLFELAEKDKNKRNLTERNNQSFIITFFLYNRYAGTKFKKTHRIA